MNAPQPTSGSALITVVIFGWLATLVSGLLYFNTYETTPGPAGSSSSKWPRSTAVRFSPGEINLLVFAHPRCPCTRASLDELKALLQDCPTRMPTHILFWVPPNASSAWTTSELWKQAGAIANAQVVADEGGEQARCFGATTSGHLMVFAPDGTRIYSGGLTNARGKSGNDSGLTLIRSLIIQQRTLPSETPVFGCPLFNLRSSADNGSELCQKPL